MSEAQVIEQRPGVTVVTSENFDAYVKDMLPPTEPEHESVTIDGEVLEVNEEETPEAFAAKELEKVEAEKAQNLEPKEGDMDGSKVFWKGKWTNKSDYSYRMHLKTEAAKLAEEKAARFESESKSEREARLALEARVKELQDKYEPPKSDELGPEPQPSQFTDVNEYALALKEWTADSTRREEAAKQAEARAQAEREQTVKAWNKRQEEAKTAIPDYAEKIANSTVKVSDQMREAILESEIGPQILYHLAENPDVADKLGALRIDKMLREFGKLEASLSTEKPQAKSVTVAEISRAPAPITPLKGASAPVSNKIGSDGEFHGTYAEWKALRESGKIK